MFAPKTIPPVFLICLAAAMVVLLASCELVGVNAERKNPHDPKNPEYVPQPPENIQARFINFDEQRGWIHITWLSRSIGQTGYLIERALDGETFEEFMRTESADITQSPVHDKTMEFRSRTAYRVTSYIERNGEIHRKMTDAVPLSFGTVRFLSAPSIRRNQLMVRFEEDRVYRDGLYFKIIAPNGNEIFAANITDELENIGSNSFSPPEYMWTHDISPDLTIPPDSQLRISWYIREDDQEIIVGSVEEAIR